jgi:N-acetylglucosaminyl-diphospho-decaprenol L-rhamnosyltransferase
MTPLSLHDDEHANGGRSPGATQAGRTVPPVVAHHDLSRLTAVVLNWRTAEQTQKAARCLVDEGIPSERLVIVDNGSGDRSYEHLKDAFPNSTVLGLPKNVGFAVANNAGAAALPGSAYLFVNSDAFVHERGSVARLVAALDQQRVGLAVPRLLNPDLTLQPSVSPLRSPAVAFVQASGLSRLVPNRFQPSWSTHWDHSRSRAVPYAVGAVIAARADVWEELGGFDQSRLMYGEDLDLSWRARKHGYLIWFTADAVFVHLGNASATKRWTAPERAEEVGKSEAEIIRRHASPLAARLTVGFMAAGMVARAVVFSRVGRREQAYACRAVARGLLS